MLLRGAENLQQTTAFRPLLYRLIQQNSFLQDSCVSVRNTSILYNEYQTYFVLKPTDEGS